MEKDTNLNLDDIVRECDLFNTADTKAVLSKIDALQKKYNKKDIVKIYNYFLSKAQNPDIIMHLISYIDSYRDESSLEVLVDVLLLKNGSDLDESTREKYMHVRIMCAKAIANQKNTNVVPSLLYCLNNKKENYRVRLACADALGKIGDKYAVAPLIEVVKDEDEKSVYLRETAASALGRLGDERAVEPLVKILESKHGIMDKFSFLKERAIEALNKIMYYDGVTKGFENSERVFKALKNSLSDESTQVRVDAIEALMESNNPEAFDIIKKCLREDADEEVKKNALIALYNMSDRSILDEVINSGEYSDKLKMAAVEIIDEYENSEDDDE